MEDVLVRISEGLRGENIEKQFKTGFPSVSFVLFRDGYVSRTRLRNCRFKGAPQEHPVSSAINSACPFPQMPETRKKQVEVHIIFTDQGPCLRSEECDDIICDDEDLKPYLLKLLTQLKTCWTSELFRTSHSYFSFNVRLDQDGTVKGAVQLRDCECIDLTQKLAALKAIKAASHVGALPERSAPLTLYVIATETHTQLLSLSKVCV